MSQNKSIIQERVIRSFAAITILGFSTLVLLKVENMLVSFVLAFVISYLLSPIVNYCERKGLSRSLGAGFVYILMGGIISLAGYFIVPELGEHINELKKEIPKYIDGTAILISDFENLLNSAMKGFYTIDISKEIKDILVSYSGHIFNEIPSYISSSLTVAILAPFFSFFMLVDGQIFIRKFLSLAPNDFFELTLNLQHQINTQIGGFVRARLMEAVIVGVVVWIGLLMIDFRYAAILATFAGITNLIPYLGPVIGTVPAVLISLVNGGSPVDVLIVISIYAFGQLVDSIFIIPIVVAKIVNLHAVIVVVVIIIGAQVGGILGMIISIPIASIIKLTSIALYEHSVGIRV